MTSHVIAAAPSYRHQPSRAVARGGDGSQRGARREEARTREPLVDSAHAAGIREVVVWDHALYELAYYPSGFRTGRNGTIDLDDPAFWAWLKQDYREMLDRVPAADGIVLTFIETGARAERQHSRTMTTPQEKLAAVVNAVADVVIGERTEPLRADVLVHARGVSRHHRCGGPLSPRGAAADEETPHDFFLTHPNDRYAGTIARPTVIEFDAAASSTVRARSPAPGRSTCLAARGTCCAGRT
jgi:hypothetical protein